MAGPIADRVKRALVGEVRGLFNDRARGETPVVPQSGGLFEPGAVARRVHGDVTAMMVGGVAALLLQMLHPAVLAGVWDHSAFRRDMLGRLRRTARNSMTLDEVRQRLDELLRESENEAFLRRL